jgi:rhomboid protease GluP
MRKSDALLRGGLSDSEANRIVVLLAAMGIETALEPDHVGRLDVYVPVASFEQAARLLAEEAVGGMLDTSPTLQHSGYRTTFEQRYGTADDLVAPEAWFGRGTVAVLALMAVCVGVFAAAQSGPDAGSRSRMLDFGAVGYGEVHNGQYWRFLSAIFLHFDVAHLIANLSVMLILAPPLAHQVGALRFIALFLASGIGGNVVSHVLVPSAGLKAGASGAIAGVLGALGGLALRPERQTRYRSCHRLGAWATISGLLFGLGRGRDNVAHFAGLVVGFLLGRLMRPLGAGEL